MKKGHGHTHLLHEQLWLYVCDQQINGELTLSENIADNGGVHAAFQAYKDVNGTSGEQALIGGHTVDQLFFVAFAQVHGCSYK